MEEKLKLKLPLIVEGRYDKSALSGYVDGTIITTGGFSVFNDKEKQALIRRIGAGGIIVLTDSDGGGKQIRSFLAGLLPGDKIHHLYIPRIEGKERRKARASRSGVLGVEGMSREVISRLLAPFCTASQEDGCRRLITKTDLYLDGLTGGECSGERRRRICAECQLPDDMTPNAFLEAMNILYGYDEYKALAEKIK